MILYKDLSEEEQAGVRRQFCEFFAGRLETYAIRVERGGARASYAPSNNPSVAEQIADIGTGEFTEEVVHRHLLGDYLIGVYPITRESNVRFFALDFDGKNGDPYKEACAQAAVLRSEGGLSTTIERSQSGNGYHVWGFFEEEVSALKVRHALKPLIERTDTFDRMFPNQDGVSEKTPLGNLIALPLAGSRLIHGNSAFVKHDAAGRPEPYENQHGVLARATLIPATKLEELFVRAGAIRPERTVKTYIGQVEGLPDGWKVSHPKFGCDFMRWAYEHPYDVSEPLWYAIACNLSQLSDGRQLFHDISARDDLRYDEEDCDKKYDQALEQNKPHTCEKIRDLGGDCQCDYRFPNVHHPFEIARIPFKRLVETITIGEADTDAVMDAATGFKMTVDWIREVEGDPSIGQGRKYGIDSLDVHTGLRDSDLIILAARPAMGKTAFMSTIVDNACMAGVPNYVFSAEMSSVQFYRRQMSTRAGVHQDNMSKGRCTPEDWERVLDAQVLVSDPLRYQVWVDDMSRSTDRIFEQSARLVHTHGKGIIWIDYLQLLQRNPGELMFDQVTRITHDLKLLAKALDCPVVALTQLNRTADDATSESQTMDSWLRGSGDIEQAADVIIFILGVKGPGVVPRILAIHKERHREGGHRVELQFNQAEMRFADKGRWSSTAPKSEARANAPVISDADEEELEAETYERLVIGI
jgi:hypothetical protein